MPDLIESKVVCPHCWQRFYTDEACFISRHQELYGDAVLGDLENRRFAPHEVERDRAGIALDPMGWKMTERACPQCHLQIPPELLRKRPYFISVAGVPGAGKTYFLTAMIHTLRKELANNFGFSMHDSDSHEVRAFLEYEKALFFPADPTRPTLLHKTQESGTLYNKVRLNQVDVQLPKPFIFSLLPTASHPAAEKLTVEGTRNLVLYDNAGESFEVLKDKNSNVRVTQHLGECDALLFTFDPLQVPEIRARLASCSQDPQLSIAAKSYRQETTLAEIINRMRRFRQVESTKLLEPVLAVCVQKYDTWRSLLPFSHDPVGNLPLIDHTSIHFVQKQGIAGLDVEDINRISLLVRAFLHDISPEFVALAETHFRTVRYFPVSSLGGSPQLDSDQLLKVSPAQVQPFRVTEPLLWLLRQWGLIFRTRRKAPNVNTMPWAKWERLTDGRLKITPPQGGRSWILDDEYSESSVIDPEVGQWMWIPKVDPVANIISATPITASEQPKSSASESLQLKLSPPPSDKPPHKKGWFRK